MKKANPKDLKELRPEYERSDFGTLVRGKYAARIAEETNIVVLEPEIARRTEDALKGGFIRHVPGDRSPRGELVELLQSWIEESDAQEQKETGKYLIRVLD